MVESESGFICIFLTTVAAGSGQPILWKLGGLVRSGSWSCKNAVAEALTRWDFGDVAVHGHFRNLTVFRTGSAADKDSSHLGWFCNDRLLRAGGYALIAAMSGLVPMMFMTRVRL
jgi:hypothetical protein